MYVAVVQPPDEWAVNVSNSVFTNMIAKRSLLFAAKVALMHHLSKRAYNYSYYAKRVYIPFDSTIGYHPEYSGYVIGAFNFYTFCASVFSARQHAERAICYRNSVCLSVCLSVRLSVRDTGGSVKNG